MVDKNLVININKHKGITSQQAVTTVKRLLSVKKAGHAGTLDPMATGVLLVCTGEATKITRFLADADKEYIALMKLGERTDTLDAEGEVIERVEQFSLEYKTVESVLDRFRGVIRQTPPMYSAIKVGGKPLYKLARKGIEISRPDKTVTIYRLDITAFAPPFLEIKVLCSKGTYIRSLCDDIGSALGVGAHITALERIRIGDFKVQDSSPLDDLQRNEKAFFSIDEALRNFKDISLCQRDFLRAANGMALGLEISERLTENSYLRLKSPEGKLFAIGLVTGSAIRIERLLNIFSERKTCANS